MRTWVLGVEDIRPLTFYAWGEADEDGTSSLRISTINPRVEGTVVYQTQRNHELMNKPFRATVRASDELGIYVEFLRRCKACGLEVGEPPNKEEQ